MALYESLEVFATTIDNLEKEARNRSIKITVRQTFNDDPTDAIIHLKVLIKLLIQCPQRIFH